MPQDLIDEIDAHRDPAEESRSEYIRDAVKQRMAEEDASNRDPNGENGDSGVSPADA